MTKAHPVLPYGRQSIDEDDIQAVVDSLRGDFLTTGPRVAEFEKALCAATGAREAVVSSNGTTALHLAALALGLGEGDAVIVPSLTFLATANAVRYTGAEVVFADVDPQTGQMGPEHLEDAVKRCKSLAPRAVFPVHLTGQCVDLPALKKEAQKHNLAVITDACHALGASTNGHKVGDGALEDMAVFSFHPVKSITSGEGGAVTTNNPEWARKMRALRSHGMVKREDIGPWAYDMPEIGFNYRLTDIQCALGISQIKKLDRFIKRRRELAERYDKLLAPLNAVRPPQRIPHCESSWHLYAARIDFKAAGLSRADLMKALAAKGVGSQVHYIPVHTQPYYRKRYGEINLPGAEHYYRHTLSLPLFPAMKDEDVDFVVNSLRDVLK